jgi:hypothetical protein
MAEPIILAELTGFTDVATSAVYRYSTGAEQDPYTGRGFITSATDTPAHTPYDSRLITPGVIRRSLFGAGGAGVRSNAQAEVSYGYAVLNNIDGALDSLFDGTAGVSFRERQIRLLTVMPGAAYSTATVAVNARISQAKLSLPEVEVGIRDRMYELESQHQTVLFAGNNSLPNGLEGVDDLKGKPKPLPYGKVYGMPLKFCNTSRLIAQVSARTIVSVDAVYDGGNLLTAGAAYSSQADMETNAPTAGQYRVWNTTGMCYVRFGSSPVYKVTADVTADSGANSTCAQLLKTLATERGFSGSDISSSDVTALDALEAGVLGWLVDSTITTVELMSNIARGIASFWTDNLGVLRMKRFDLPSGTASVVIAPWNCQAVEQVQNDEDMPTTTIRLKYAKYWEVQERNEVAGAVSEARRVDIGQEWRVSTATTTPSPNPHRRVRQAEIETAYSSKTDADAAATRLLNLTSAPRRTHILKGVMLSHEELSAVELGGVIELRWGRYGFSVETGTLRRVIAIETSLRDRRSDITVWGA